MKTLRRHEHYQEHYQLPKKKIKKDKQLMIRLNEKMRDEFVSICNEMDTSAAREIRKFIKQFIEKNDPR